MDFMQKILNTFPDINAEYLLMGEGPVLKEMDLFTASDKIKEEKNAPAAPPETGETEKPEKNIDLTFKPASQIEQDNQKHKLQERKGNIERIVFFYDNGLFDVYIPGKEDIS